MNTGPVCLCPGLVCTPRPTWSVTHDGADDNERFEPDGINAINKLERRKRRDRIWIERSRLEPFLFFFRWLGTCRGNFVDCFSFLVNQYFNSLSICIIYDDEFTKKESYRYTKVIKKRKDLKKQHDVTHFFHSLYISQEFRSFVFRICIYNFINIFVIPTRVLSRQNNKLLYLCFPLNDSVIIIILSLLIIHETIE